MKITILNGDTADGDSDFGNYLDRLEKELKKENKVIRFDLKAMDLKYCMGCWTCWWKTPGRCAIKDDGEKIFREVINSDFFIFASPLVAGFTTAELKKICDRLIVLLHPYIKIKEGEFHHRKRYARYPDFGLIVQAEEDTDDIDLKIVSEIYDRLALNFHARKKYLRTIDKTTIEGLANETCSN
ncbi:MAG: NAD(P)H-dependent oxidoreductase [Bacteroidales bacterium]|nr:NAD(P)H-dependent oxidoreductase [Bacteroidales bacterium]